MVENQSLIVLYDYLTHIIQKNISNPDEKEANEVYQDLRGIILNQEKIKDLITLVLTNSETIREFKANLGFTGFSIQTYKFKDRLSSEFKDLENYCISEYLLKNQDLEEINDPLFNKSIFVTSMIQILKDQRGNMEFHRRYNDLRFELLESDLKLTQEALKLILYCKNVDNLIHYMDMLFSSLTDKKNYLNRIFLIKKTRKRKMIICLKNY